MYTYQCYGNYPYRANDEDYYGKLTEEGAPIVGNLITSEDYRICPAIGAIDSLISQNPTLPHYGHVRKEGHNIDRCIITISIGYPVKNWSTTST